MFAVSNELSLAFSTPLSLRTLPAAAALNIGLERAILIRCSKLQGNRISNVGGWQSLPDFMAWPEPEVKSLTIELDRTVQQIMTLPWMLDHPPAPGRNRVHFEAYAWANVNKTGDYNSFHMHPGSDLSVVYYVTTGTPMPDTPTNGRLELRDPRPAAIFSRKPGSALGQSLLIRPHPGMMLAFPAWIEHGVHPFHGEGHRISIAFNISVEQQDPTRVVY